MEADPSGVRMLDESRMLETLRSALWLTLPVVDAWILENEHILGSPAWADEAGMLSSVDAQDIIVYLVPRRGLSSFFPSTLVLTLKPGRYAIATWDSTMRQRIGIEIATASPLVCGPPCNGSPIFLVIKRLH